MGRNIALISASGVEPAAGGGGAAGADETATIPVMDDPMVRQSLGFLRGHTSGDLRFDEHLRSIKYVVGSDGRLAAPVMAAMLDTVDTVLYIPEYREENLMEVQVTLDRFMEEQRGGVIADRWRIYHGEPEDIYWALLNVDAVRYAEHVIDGNALMIANTLASDEPRICKHMNAEHTDDLRLLCHHFSHIEIENPKVVGIDQLGIDVRGRFDVVRVKATEPFKSAEHARETLKAMIETARKHLS